MDLSKMIAELQAEKERLDEAIQALERLAANKVRRKGRPPRREEHAPEEHEDAEHDNEETPQLS